jgi:cytidine deaminase
MTEKELLQLAEEASNKSYSPYSHFRVGAALLCDDGTVVTAANIENRSFGLTICAERSAVVKAHSLGKTGFKALAISCPDAEAPVSPCGACRQVVSEFVAPDFPVYFCGKDREEYVATTMEKLLPYDALHNLKDSL